MTLAQASVTVAGSEPSSGRARSASAINHPNIRTIYEFGEHEGQPFIALELPESATLRDLIGKGTLGSALGGWISDLLSNRSGKRLGRCVLAVAGLVGSALFIVLATQVAGTEVASIYFALGTASLFMAHSSHWSVTADIAGTSAGSASGLMNTAAHFAGAITAILTPMIAGSFGWTASFPVPAVLCTLGALPWLLVDPNDRLQAE